MVQVRGRVRFSVEGFLRSGGGCAIRGGSRPPITKPSIGEFDGHEWPAFDLDVTLFPEQVFELGRG